MLITDPSATADGTDLVQARCSTFEARSCRAFVVCALAFYLLCPVAFSVAQKDQPRDLWDTAFSSGRRNQKRAGRSYHNATPAISPNEVAGDTVVGVTIWRLRPAKADVEGERIVVHDNEETEAWIPERVTNSTNFTEGDRVRLSIEAARTGYLYVINREQYADGTLGEPFLIFPTTRTRGGDNCVQSRLLVDIPAQDDRPPYLTLRRRRGDQSAEVLSFIITRLPLDAVQISERAQKLDPVQVATWEKSWGGPLGRLELNGGVGQAWTRNEREASAATAARLLSSDAPAPQTIYYSPAIKSDAPFLVTVKLNYGRPRPSRLKGR